MTAIKKDKRLRKVAAEFNLGTNTIVEFLEEKGFDLGHSPNAKVTPDMYDLLEGKFQLDRSLKEEKEAVKREFHRERKADKELKEKQEEVIVEPEISEPSIAEVKKEPEVIKVDIPKPKFVGNIDLDDAKKKPKKEKEVKESPIAKEEPKLEKVSGAKIDQPEAGFVEPAVFKALASGQPRPFPLSSPCRPRGRR